MAAVDTIRQLAAGRDVVGPRAAGQGGELFQCLENRAARVEEGAAAEGVLAAVDDKTEEPDLSLVFVGIRGGELKHCSTEIGGGRVA